MTKIEQLQQLQQFIKNNNLEFVEGRRNSDLVVLCGYALYINATDIEIWDSIPEDIEGADFSELETELFRVFSYAEKNNYGKWWENETNRNQYKL